RSARRPYSLGLLEAIAAGPVVITSAVGGPREYLVDGQNALLFDPGEVDALAAHLTAVARDPELVRRITAGAAATAPSLSLDVVVGQMEQLLRAAPARTPTSV